MHAPEVGLTGFLLAIGEIHGLCLRISRGSVGKVGAPEHDGLATRRTAARKRREHQMTEMHKSDWLRD